MVQEGADHFAEATPVPEIEALLTLSNSLSIFDRLMAMPRAETKLDNEWDRAVASRLQTKVTDLMKQKLETPERQQAA